LRDFNEAVNLKLKARDFNFQGVWFPEKASFAGPFTTDVNFAEAIFSDNINFANLTFISKADFSQATFQGTANFNDAEFQDAANFSGSRFLKNADFINASFKQKADFSYSEFCAEANFETTFDHDVDFLYVFFRGEAYFRYAFFNGPANFRSASFKDYLRFGGEELSKEAEFDFQYARIEKPERIAFHSLALRPYWFVNVDTRRFDFVNVDWQWKTLSIESEVKKLEDKKVTAVHRLLAIAFRDLALNAEEDQRFEEASRFRYLSSQLWRKNEPHDLLTSIIGWLYWAASGYGARVFRALIVLVGIWLIFAALYTSGTLYTHVGFEAEPTKSSSTNSAAEDRSPAMAPLAPAKSLIYSLNTMTLQKPDPRPLTSIAKGLVLLETIIGPIQAALLALAIRRKFMR